MRTIIPDTLGSRIRQARNTLGLRQEEIAVALVVSRQSVSDWEAGDFEPQPERLLLLAELLGVSVAWLEDGEDEQEEDMARLRQEIAVEAISEACGVVRDSLPYRPSELLARLAEVLRREGQ